MTKWMPIDRHLYDRIIEQGSTQLIPRSEWGKLEPIYKASQKQNIIQVHVWEASSGGITIEVFRAADGPPRFKANFLHAVLFADGTARICGDWDDPDPHDHRSDVMPPWEPRSA